MELSQISRVFKINKLGFVRNDQQGSYSKKR